MSEDILRTVEFDIRGQICPSSLLVALREINRHYADLQSGELQLLFKTDNRQAVNTIPESAGNMGLSCSVEKSQTGYILVVAK
jgi:TusA-related sulfurtransferase